MDFKFTADAATIHGRLILRICFDLCQDDGLLTFEALSYSSIGFYPHLWTPKSARVEIAGNPLLAAIHLAFNVSNDLNTANDRFYSCDS